MDFSDFLVSYAGLKGIIAMVPPNTIPDEAKIEMNLAVLLFTTAVSVVAAIISGLAPHSTCPGVTSRLR